MERTGRVYLKLMKLFEQRPLVPDLLDHKPASLPMQNSNLVNLNRNKLTAVLACVYLFLRNAMTLDMTLSFIKSLKGRIKFGCDFDYGRSR